MSGLGLFHNQFAFFWEMNSPILMSWAPEVSLVVDFLDVRLPILRILLIPLVFSLAILILIASLFLTLSLAVAFTFAFTFSGGRGLKVLG